MELPPFLLGRTEVTQAQWEALMPWNPAEFRGRGSDLPRKVQESPEAFHPNEAGHRLAGEEIAAWRIARKLVPLPSPRKE